MEFYRRTNPWGFWKPVRLKVEAKYPDFVANQNFGRDTFNVVIGVAWQMTLVIMPIYLIIREFDAMTITLGVFLVASYILKRNWWDKLED